jgi:hypothetical protein
MNHEKLLVPEDWHQLNHGRRQESVETLIRRGAGQPVADHAVGTLFFRLRAV